MLFWQNTVYSVVKHLRSLEATQDSKGAFSCLVLTNFTVCMQLFPLKGLFYITRIIGHFWIQTSRNQILVNQPSLRASSMSKVNTAYSCLCK